MNILFDILQVAEAEMEKKKETMKYNCNARISK